MKNINPTSEPAPVFAALSPRLIGSTLEILEARIAPAIISAPAVFTYTDADGDQVKVKLAGTGSAEFLDAAQMDVSLVPAGADIATIIVRNPGKDFALTFADTNPAAGDNIIELGKIAGESGARLPVIKGVFTIDSAMSVTYNLGGYKGSDFADGGGLQILGGVTQPAVGGSSLDLLTLKSGRTVSLRDGIAAVATAAIAGEVAGRFIAGGNVDGSVLFGSVSGAARFAEVPGDVTIAGDLSGRLSVTGGLSLVPSGSIEVNGSLTPTARVNAGALHLDVAKNASGFLEVIQDLTLSVGKNLKDALVLGGANAVINVGSSVISSSVFVQGAIAAGSSVGMNIVDSEISVGTGLALAVGAGATSPTGSVIRSRIVGGTDDATITIASAVTESEIVAGSAMTLDIGGGVSDANISADASLLVTIGGDLSSSRVASRYMSLDAMIAGGVIGSKLLTGDLLTISVGRSISNSQINAGSTLNATVSGRVVGSKLIAAGAITLSADGNVANSNLTAKSTLALTTGGNIVRSQLISGSTVNVSIGGSVKKSSLLDGEAIVADIAGDVIGSRLLSAGAGRVVDGANLTIGGVVSDTIIDSGLGVAIANAASISDDVVIRSARDAKLTVGDLVGARILAAGNVTIRAGGSFTGSINAGQSVQLDLGDPGNGSAPLAGIATTHEIRAGGNLSLHTTGKVHAGRIEVGGSVVDFAVGGKFDAPLHVAGNFFVGSNSATSAMVIAGKVTASTLIEIDGDLGGAANSATELIFGNAFLGRLEVGGRLAVDLEFDGPVNTIGIAGGVGPTTAGDGIAQIVINGSVSRFTSGSLFKRTDANGGNFVDGAGTKTGSLTASGGAPVVEPEDFS